jgi:hypothetical protein
MESKSYPAFGYVAVKNKFTAGEIFTAEPVFNNEFTVGIEFPYIWMYTKNGDTFLNQVTQEEIVYTVGDCTTTKPIPYGAWRSLLPSDMEMICISGFANSNRTPPVPNVNVFKLSKNESATILDNTKLFLAEGVLNIAGTDYVGVKQIRFITGDKVVTAKEDCYGLIFL